MTRHQTLAFPFISPTSFYNVGVGTEKLTFRPEWAGKFKERDMTNAVERIGKYLKSREVHPMKQLGDGIHVVQVGSEWEAELLLSDLREFHNSHASLVEEVERLRDALNGIASLIGNVDHSRGGGENTARMYGGMLNDIRDIANTTIGTPNG